MAKEIHHINILVKNLDQALEAFSQFLNETPITENLPLRGATSARFNCNGVWLVLVSPTTDTSELNKIVASRGEGVFLISFQSINLDREIDELVQKNIALSASSSRKGADDWMVQDIQLSYPLDVVIQLCEVVSK